MSSAVHARQRPMRLYAFRLVIQWTCCSHHNNRLFILMWRIFGRVMIRQKCHTRWQGIRVRELTKFPPTVLCLYFIYIEFLLHFRNLQNKILFVKWGGDLKVSKRVNCFERLVRRRILKEFLFRYLKRCFDIYIIRQLLIG